MTHAKHLHDGVKRWKFVSLMFFTVTSLFQSSSAHLLHWGCFIKLATESIFSLSSLFQSEKPKLWMKLPVSFLAHAPSVHIVLITVKNVFCTIFAFLHFISKTPKLEVVFICIWMHLTLTLEMTDNYFPWSVPCLQGEQSRVQSCGNCSNMFSSTKLQWWAVCFFINIHPLFDCLEFVRLLPLKSLSRHPAEDTQQHLFLSLHEDEMHCETVCSMRGGEMSAKKIALIYFSFVFAFTLWAEASVFPGCCSQSTFFQVNLASVCNARISLTCLGSQVLHTVRFCQHRHFG